MDMKEAIQELGNVVNACSYLMPKVWQDAHMEDAKEALETMRDIQREDEVNKAKRWFVDEIRSCQMGISGGYVDPALMEEQIKIYTVALEGLGKL